MAFALKKYNGGRLLVFAMGAFAEVLGDVSQHRRRRRLCAARGSLRWGRNWAAQRHLARAVGKRFWGCRAKRLYVHKNRARLSAPLRPVRGQLLNQVVKSRFTPQMTRKPNTRNRAPLTCLSGQPALKVRLAASSKRDGSKLKRIASASPTAAAVWAECTSDVAGDAAQNARAVL